MPRLEDHYIIKLVKRFPLAEFVCGAIFASHCYALFWAVYAGLVDYNRRDDLNGMFFEPAKKADPDYDGLEDDLDQSVLTAYIVLLVMFINSAIGIVLTVVFYKQWTATDAKEDGGVTDNLEAGVAGNGADDIAKLKMTKKTVLGLVVFTLLVLNGTVQHDLLVTSNRVLLDLLPWRIPAIHGSLTNVGNAAVTAVTRVLGPTCPAGQSCVSRSDSLLCAYENIASCFGLKSVDGTGKFWGSCNHGHDTSRPDCSIPLAEQFHFPRSIEVLSLIYLVLGLPFGVAGLLLALCKVLCEKFCRGQWLPPAQDRVHRRSTVEDTEEHAPTLNEPTVPTAISEEHELAERTLPSSRRSSANGEGGDAETQIPLTFEEDH